MTNVEDLHDLTALNELYGLSEDPWHLRGGWYSDRKRDVLLGCLPRARYANSLEIGCGSGQLTVALARRTELLVAVDSRDEMIAQTRGRVRSLSNVTTHKLHSLDQLPSHELFDLIVLNEVGYQASAADWAHTCSSVSSRLAAEATVVACHWRHEVAERKLETETVHGMLDSMLGLTKQTQLTDADFIIDVWTTSHRSVAAADGLV